MVGNIQAVRVRSTKMIKKTSRNTQDVLQVDSISHTIKHTKKRDDIGNAYKFKK